MKRPPQPKVDWQMRCLELEEELAKFKAHMNIGGWTVGQMIEILQKYSPHLPVVIEVDDKCAWPQMAFEDEGHSYRLGFVHYVCIRADT